MTHKQEDNVDFKTIMDYPIYKNERAMRVFFHLILTMNGGNSAEESDKIPFVSEITYEKLALELNITARQAKYCLCQLQLSDFLSLRKGQNSVIISLKTKTMTKILSHLLSLRDITYYSFIRFILNTYKDNYNNKYNNNIYINNISNKNTVQNNNCQYEISNMPYAYLLDLNAKFMTIIETLEDRKVEWKVSENSMRSLMKEYPTESSLTGTIKAIHWIADKHEEKDKKVKDKVLRANRLLTFMSSQKKFNPMDRRPGELMSEYVNRVGIQNCIVD